MTKKEITTQENELLETLQKIANIEKFFMEIAHELPSQKKYFKLGEDITPQLKKMNVTIPEYFQNEPLIWLGDEDKNETENIQSISLVRPGNPTALGYTLGCISWGRVIVCLECGWFYCRIVIKGRWVIAP